MVKGRIEIRGNKLVRRCTNKVVLRPRLWLVSEVSANLTSQKVQSSIHQGIPSHHVSAHRITPNLSISPVHIFQFPEFTKRTDANGLNPISTPFEERASRTRRNPIAGVRIYKNILSFFTCQFHSPRQKLTYMTVVRS